MPEESKGAEPRLRTLALSEMDAGVVLAGQYLLLDLLMGDAQDPNPEEVVEVLKDGRIILSHNTINRAVRLLGRLQVMRHGQAARDLIASNITEFALNSKAEALESLTILMPRLQEFIKKSPNFAGSAPAEVLMACDDPAAATQNLLDTARGLFKDMDARKVFGEGGSATSLEDLCSELEGMVKRLQEKKKNGNAE